MSTIRLFGPADGITDLIGKDAVCCRGAFTIQWCISVNFTREPRGQCGTETQPVHFPKIRADTIMPPIELKGNHREIAVGCGRLQRHTTIADLGERNGSLPELLPRGVCVGRGLRNSSEREVW